MKNLVYRAICIYAIVLFIFTVTSCKIGRFAYYNFAGIKDYKIFDARVAKNDSVAFKFSTADSTQYPVTINVKGIDVDFDAYLEKNKTVAFLIIKNDTILYENYFRGYNQESIVASFSMAKSVTSILVGCAIDDGYIKSVNEPIISYVPELKNPGMEQVTIKHLLQMTSGISFDENYFSPFADMATYYYGGNLHPVLYRRQLVQTPGKRFKYSSGDTQLLGLVLTRALKGKTLTEYLQEKLWKPLGMEYDATWSLDSEGSGLEKTFCCINARARDFAKIGRLYLNKGNWNGRQIVSKSWVEESIRADRTNGGSPNYKYNWWLQEDGSFMAKGVLGQFIFVNPNKNIVIVRLGKSYGNVFWPDLIGTLSREY